MQSAHVRLPRSYLRADDATSRLRHDETRVGQHAREIPVLQARATAPMRTPVESEESIHFNGLAGCWLGLGGFEPPYGGIKIRQDLQ